MSDRTVDPVADQRLDEPTEPEPREIPAEEVAQFFHDEANIQSYRYGVGWVDTGVRMTVDGETVVPTSDDASDLIEAALLGKDVNCAVAILREKIENAIREREES